MTGLGRAATWVALAVLGLNAVLLGAAGLVAGRPGLVLAAGGALLAAGIVAAAWRRHQRALADLRAERHALRDEALALRELIRRDPPPS